ncbi:hypothetical protein MTR67_040171 [Solanum verrucosum]|uniref:Endonuclease/exonuclease/phosphatase domain-containing protein n=1 Tax=Solanum verrucosum TaxID=315347 RepID=A0AAF0ZPJ1_SOLVR|nr:hypothetical protein MTR67_040171 [Solanum verrucosum]
MGNKGKVVKKIWHKKSPNDARRKAISMLAGTLVTTQEEQWQNVKGKSKTIPHPAQNTVDTRNGFNPLVLGTIQSKPLKSMGKDMSQDMGGGEGGDPNHIVFTVEAMMQYIHGRDLREIHMNQQGAWLALGDYNAIPDPEDRIRCNPVREMEIVDFNEFLLDTSMTEMRSSGRSFTWTNNHVSSKIHRPIVNRGVDVDVPTTRSPCYGPIIFKPFST